MTKCQSGRKKIRRRRDRSRRGTCGFSVRRLTRKLRGQNHYCRYTSGSFVRGYYQDTLLHLAARCGQVEVCRWLIENGTDVNVRNKQNTTPLILAATYNRVSAAKILLAAGADPRLTDINRNALSAAQIQSKLAIRPRRPSGLFGNHRTT